MAWSTPRTWVAGELVTDTMMNTHVRDQLAAVASGIVPSDRWQLVGKTAAQLAGQLSPSGSAALAYDADNGTIVASLNAGSYTPIAARPYLQADGRLTLTSGVPVTTSDVTGATTIYYSPYLGNRLALYSGTLWTVYAFSELSIAVPGTTNTVYDVFAYANAGVPTLELTAWTNDTTRATALTRQDGVLVKSGATTRRYLGTFRTTGTSGQTEDSETKRYLWNAENRVSAKLKKLDTTSSWTYGTAAWRQARGSSANQVECVLGLDEEIVEVHLQVIASIAVGDNGFAVGLALDATTPTADTVGADVAPSGSGERITISAHYAGHPGIGRHFIAWCEYGNATAAVTFYGVGLVSGSVQSGLLGWVRR